MRRAIEASSSGANVSDFPESPHSDFLELTGDEDARDEAVEALRDLADWLEKGGFPPRTAFVASE